jgi:hypothetical protein
MSWKTQDVGTLTHVDGVRLRLWTAVTNGPIVHSPGDIWARRTMEEFWCWQRKTDSSTGASWQSYQQSHLVASRKNGRKEWEFGTAKYCVHTWKWYLHAVKFTTWGPRLYFPCEGRKVCCGFLSPVKIQRFCQVWTHYSWVHWQARYPLHHRGKASGRQYAQRKSNSAISAAPGMLERVRASFRRRADAYVHARGGYFEYLLFRVQHT